jgi:hypothetical protein
MTLKNAKLHYPKIHLCTNEPNGTLKTKPINETLYNIYIYEFL